MKLRPDEEAVQFEGFTTPVGVYRVDRSRVRGAWITMGFLGFVAVAIVGFGAMFLSDPKQINKPFLAVLVGGFALAWLGLTLWIYRRLARFGRQRVLLYAEGIVVWRDGEPCPLRWEQIRSIDCKRKQITRGTLERWAHVGKDTEYRLATDDGQELILNAMLSGIDELGSHMEQQLRDRGNRSGSSPQGLSS